MMTLTMQVPELHVGRGTQAGPLTVFPVWSSDPEVTSVAMGLSSHVEVTERAGSPVVGELIVRNTGITTALLVEGELLEGGWQHRALRHDLILNPGSTMVAPVVCVEAGRWSGDGRVHARHARRASGNVRAAMRSPDNHARQGRVWSQVSAYDRSMGASQTSSYVDHLDRLQDSTDRPRTPILDGQRGVIVGLAGQPVLLEVFPSHSCLATALPDLLASLMLDALASGAAAEVTPGRRARRLVERLDARHAHHASALDAGAGQTFVLDTPYAALRGVTLDEGWAHLTAFNRRHPLVEFS
jgi:hypothetical protein